MSRFSHAFILSGAISLTLLVSGCASDPDPLPLPSGPRVTVSPSAVPDTAVIAPREEEK